jgi:hypothetical protein
MYRSSGGGRSTQKLREELRRHLRVWTPLTHRVRHAQPMVPSIDLAMHQVKGHGLCVGLSEQEGLLVRGASYPRLVHELVDHVLHARASMCRHPTNHSATILQVAHTPTHAATGAEPTATIIRVGRQPEGDTRHPVILCAPW